MATLKVYGVQKVMIIEENKLVLDQAEFAKHGMFKNLMIIHLDQKTSEMASWKETTAEIQIALKIQSGVIPLIKTREENSVIQFINLRNYQVKKVFQKIHLCIEDHKQGQGVEDCARIGIHKPHTSTKTIIKIDLSVICSLTSVETQMVKIQFGAIPLTHK